MKTTIALAALLLVTGTGFAQLVNADFEEWEGDNPVGWGNLNYPDIFQAVRASENAFSGSYAAQLMITEQLGGSILSQQIAVSDVDETVTLELHYAGLPEGTDLAVSLTASFEGSLIDGSVDVYDDHGADYQSATLVWNPQFENYDTLGFFFTFSASVPLAGSVLLDHLVLTGVSGQGVGRGEGNEVVDNWELLTVFPNPFNTQTTVGFNLPDAGLMDVGVYDLAGRRVATIANGIFTPGEHNVPWAASERLGAGAYIVRLNTGNRSFNTRAVFLK
jgi:hypothetical protein